MKYRLKKTPLIFSVIFLLISGIIFSVTYWKIKTDTETTKQSETAYQTEAIKRNEIKTLNNYFKSIEKEKAQFETHFVQSSDVVPFLNTLESLAESVGTKAEVNSINVGTKEDEKGLFVEIKDVGRFEQVYKFLTLLENSPYELEFVSVDLHSISLFEEAKTVQKVHTWEAVLKLKLISFI